MRRKNETATSFDQLKEITQAIQAQKNSAPKHKGSAHAKNSALKPKKKAFSERQIITIRGSSQASAKESQRGRNV
ncbi:hypothetical protein BTM431_15180 [Helicobacter pylori]